MAINITKLWRQGSFQKLSNDAKLLYIYYTTASNINCLGLLFMQPESLMFDLSMDNIRFRLACIELSDVLVKYYKHDEDVYVLVIHHFDTLPRSEAVYKRSLKDIKSVPDTVLDSMVSDGVYPNVEQYNDFVVPTVDEVYDYGISLGYIIDAKAFVDFYTDNAKRLGKNGFWDGRNKQVRDWKAKLRKVWTRNAEKLEAVEGAPEGYEYFHVKDDSGRMIRATRWKDGKPFGSGLLEDKMLQKTFNERNS